MNPPESLAAVRALFQFTGEPIRMAVATVSGLATGSM
jgi:hypothetical protein